MITAAPFVRVFLGDCWVPVAGLLVVFAPLGALQLIVAPVGLIFESQARTDLRFRWMMFASVCYMLSFVIGLHWGFLGVGVSLPKPTVDLEAIRREYHEAAEEAGEKKKKRSQSRLP